MTVSAGWFQIIPSARIGYSARRHPPTRVMYHGRKRSSFAGMMPPLPNTSASPCRPLVTNTIAMRATMLLAPSAEYTPNLADSTSKLPERHGARERAVDLERARCRHAAVDQPVTERTHVPEHERRHPIRTWPRSTT